MKDQNKQRCDWIGPKSTELDIAYHDTEWGVPVHDDTKLFEFLVLEGAQAGLSWQTILKKREGYRRAFVGFDAKKIAKFSEKDVEQLMNNENIVRNRLKINSVIINAQKFLEVQKEFGSFDKFIWSFVDGKTIKSHHKSIHESTTTTKQSDAMSKELKKRGFKFIGSTICYAFMQATGMVDDHTTNCWKY